MSAGISEPAIRVAAYGIGIVHAVWVAFLVGGVMIFRGHRWGEGLHVAGLVVNVFLDVTGIPCPLTVVENALRLRCDPPCAYQGSCVTHYLAETFPALAWPGVQMWVGVLLLVAALWRYGFLRRRSVAAPHRAHRGMGF